MISEKDSTLFDNIVEKCIKVLESCNTISHLRMAERYIMNAGTFIGKTLGKEFERKFIILTHPSHKQTSIKIEGRY